MIYPANFEDKVDFTNVRKLLKEMCLCTLGERCCDEMRFTSRYETVVEMLEQTSEFLAIIESGVEFPLNNYFDMTRPLVAVRAQGSYLTEAELFALMRSLTTIADIAAFFNRCNDDGDKYPRLTALVSAMETFPAIVASVDAILDKNGVMKDNASPELLALKRKLASTTAGINGLLRRVLTQGRSEGYIDKDAAPSMRDGRLVIPIAPMNKRRIRGIVHDESATGKTVYIEPAEIVEANNAVREIEAQIEREILRILTVVTAEIRPHIDQLLASYAILGQIDFIRAKALLARQIGGCLPHIEREPEIEWYHAVHPMLFVALKAQGKEVVPLNITLDGNSRILIISGPNAGGKSVCLKTVSAVQYMTQCGLLPPLYSNSHMGIYHDIFVDIGDEQSMENDLSTYSSHLTSMKLFLNRGNELSLVLIDEFGGGTEPQIGGAIAQAILARLNEKRVFGVITTHYQNLKHYAEDTPGIVNGAMLYDRQQMRPLFQLSIGYPGSSFAVEIARKIGLPADVIAEAESIVGSDYVNMDKYLLDIARDRKYWQGKRQEVHNRERKLEAQIEQYDSEIERLAAGQRQIISQAKSEAKAILENANATIERTIREIKEAQAEKEKTKEARRQIDELKSRLDAADAGASTVKRNPSLARGKKKRAKRQDAPLQTTADGTVAAGDYVLVDRGTTPCLVMDVDGKQATVAMGDFSSRVALSRLKKTAKPQAKERPVTLIGSSTSDAMRKRQLNFKQDIDVRGFRAEEAVQAVTYFIDDARQFNARRVRILHGTGNGILRVCIRQYLDSVHSVVSYRDEDVRFGGAGITVVDLD